MADYISSILNHAINSSSPRSMEKGKLIFNQKALQLLHLDAAREEANFSVRGTRLYYVDITRFISGKIHTHCSCPYDWGGICKHEVASLLFLAQQLKNEKLGVISKENIVQQKFIEKRNASEPYAISNYLPFDTFDLRTHIDSTELRIPVKIESIDFLKLENNTLKYELTTWNYLSSFYNREKKFIVTLQKKADQLHVSCNCNKKIEQLCTHGYATLTYIKDNANSNFLAVLDSEFIERTKKEVSKSSDIPIQLFDNYFKISIEDNAVNVNPIGLGQGFLSKETMNTFNLKEHISQQANNKLANSLPVKITAEDDEPYLLAFAINFYDQGGFYQTETIEVIPFVAKKGKVSKLKNYALYDNYKNIPITDQQALILHKIEELNELHNFSEDENEYQKLIFHKLNLLFDLLSREKHTFWQNKHTSYKKITKTNTDEINFSTSKTEIFLQLEEEDYFYALKTYLKIEEEIVELTEANVAKIIMPFFVVNYKKSLFLFKDLQQTLLAYQSLFVQTTYKAAKKDFSIFYKEIIIPLSKNFPIKFTQMENIKRETISLIPQKRQVFLSELSNFVLLQPIVAYSEDINQNIKETNSILEKKGNGIYEFLRDEDYESEFQELMDSLHPEFSKQTHSAYHFLTYDDFIKGGWVFNAFEKLKGEGVEVFGINDLKKLKISPHKAKINTHLKSGQDWFDIEINVSFGDFNVKLSDVRKAILKNERYVKLGDGKLGLLPEEWLNKLAQYFRAGETDADGVKISKLKFNLIDELFDEIDNEEILREIHEKKKRLRAFKEIKSIELPKKLKAELRDYQKEGYNWLNFLDEFKWGGILADDMGLGKTVQILTFLLKQCEENKTPNLIVIPTSLLFNWENEINKFTPSLSALFHYGVDRKKDATIFKKYNLIITSYGIMVKDVELLKAVKFNYIVLDESQAIKNPTSLRYKAACLLQANNRLTMTGTPVENNTFDLYAQVNFVNPGFLGSQPFFKDQYSIPIDRDGDAERAGELQRLINPFLLRRTKEIVATELPPKIEDIIYCEMPDAQWKVYEAFRNKYRDMLLKKVDTDGIGKSKMYVLEGLMKLRQICDSPELLNDKEDFGTTSVKIQVLMQHIQEKTGNHKILVFSQFVKMLRVIEKELVKEDIPYEYLDGQRTTKQRQKSVENFQNDENCRVFLISLKAGGTGLNLTAADYVYIVDPWWNPAVENQAIDRCHRIGQDKHVIAYRMICKNTVEEKIMQYQAKKLKIASDIITTDESFMKQIGKADIADLFG